MIENKTFLNILIGILFYASRANGQLEINLPGSGNYNEQTEMNCTDSSFDITNGYIWYKDNIQIYDNINGDATSTGKYTSTYGAGFFTLVITNTALDDNGVYRCNYNFQDKTDMLEIQAKGDGNGKLDGILKITLTEFYPGSTTVLSVAGNGMTFPGTQTITAAGDLFTIVWTSNADVDSSDVKKGCDVTIQSVTTYIIHVDVEDNSDVVSDDPGLTAGEIVGITFGVIFGVLAIAGGVAGIMYISKKKKGSGDVESREEDPRLENKR